MTLPPGELMYIDIGFSGLSASRNSNCATINALTWSVTYVIITPLTTYRSIETDDSLFKQTGEYVISPFRTALDSVMVAR